MISSDIRVDQEQCQQNPGNEPAQITERNNNKNTSSAFFNGLPILNRFKLNLYVNST